MKTTLKSLLLLTAILFSISCTRKVDNKSSVYLDFSKVFSNGSNGQQKVGSLSAQDVFVVIVNVWGPGMPPVIWQWDKNESCPNHNCAGATVTPPMTISLSVPKGPDRLIQVLAVSKDPTTNGMVFKYGDVTKSLNSLNESAAVTLAQIGSNASGGELNVAGRYLDAAGSGPTGLMMAKFNPPNNRPAMIVSEGEVINGWFSAFFVDGATFTYDILPSGRSLFSQTTMSDAQFAGATSSVLRVKVPDMYRWWGSGSVDFDSASQVALGFFGPGAGSNSVTYSPTSTPIPHAYIDAAHSTAMNWTGTTASGTSAYALAGGTTAACTGGAEFVSCLNFDPTQLSNGKDGALGIRPPFVMFTSGSSKTSMTAVANGGTPTSLDVTFKLLPDVMSAIDGVELFYKAASESPDYYRMSRGDGIDCDALAYNGFSSQAATISAASNVGAVLSVTETIPSLSASSSLVVACPYTDHLFSGRNYFAGSAYYASYYNSGGMQPAVKLAFVASGGTSNNVNACKSIAVQAQDASNNVGSLGSALTVNLSAAGGSGLFYNNSNCATTTSTVTLNTGYPSQYVYFKTAAVSSTDNLTATGAGLTNATLSLTTGASANAVTNYAFISNNSSPSGYFQDVCYPLLLEAQDASGATTVSGGSITVTLSGTAAFYSDSACQTTSSTPIIAPSTSNIMVYTKYTGAATVATGGMNSASPVASGSYSLNIVNASSNPVVSLSASGPASLTPSTCFAFVLQASDSMFTPTRSSSVANLTTTCTGSTFYATSANCGSVISPVTSVNFSGYATQVFWMRPSVTVTGCSMTADISGVTAVVNY